MSRPKHYWHPIVHRMVMRYPALKAEQSQQAQAYVEAIETEINKIKTYDDGPERLKAITLVCFDKKYTVEGAAEVVNYSPRNVQRWINNFINAVGHNVGF